MGQCNLTNQVAVEDDLCYMVVFGSEQDPIKPDHSHTFAAFLRVVQAIGSGQSSFSPGQRECLSISWLPQTKVIVTPRPIPETGENFSLIETLNWLTQPDDPDVPMHVYAWGPFRICPELYNHAAHRVEQLESGTINYIVEDLLFRPNCATNCIHALSDLGLTIYLLHTLLSHGREASCKVVHYLTPWIKNPSEKHDEIKSELGLVPYEKNIEYLEYQPDGDLMFVKPQLATPSETVKQDQP